MNKTSYSTPHCLSIIIPIYNERHSWRALLDRVEAVELPVSRQYVMIDDGSTDGTREQLEQFASQRADDDRFKIIFQERNQGKGAALRTGFESADGDIVIVQDADMEYDPSEYPKLLDPILNQSADVVYGTRFSEKRRTGGYLKNYLANRFLTILSNLTTGQKLTDMETCYKCIRRDVLKRINLEQDRFGFEPEVTAKISRLGIRIREVPISYDPRRHCEGKKIGFRDGLQAIGCILKYGLSRR